MKNFTHYQKSSGFTLIELLVVVAIIGLLSSIVLASLNSARSKARDAYRISSIRQVQTALELYYDTNGSYPPSGDVDLTTGLAGPLTLTYISKIPSDPTSVFRYYTADQTAWYTIYMPYENKTKASSTNNLIYYPR